MAEARHIVTLPENIADRIAAGEVIERPVSIVKELVENSIDAGSSSVVCEIKKGGKTYIRVTDNGSGIAAEDTETAFLRHATSKIRAVSDLDSIGTLGFRGEALASIAAVSRTELVTKTEDERAGSYVLMEGGNVADHSERGCPTGTTLIVRDLFYNTPARLKFLKSDNAESSRIIDFMSKIALAYPDMRVRMINNGNTLFSTPGRGSRLAAISAIYDPHLAKKLIRVEKSSDNEEGFSIEGYISSPDNTRKTRKDQIFFVNGRYIKSRLLETCVSDAYSHRMFEGRFPIAFLFLKVDPSFTDVNIHPNKQEIRFDDDALVKEFVTEAVREALMSRDAVPEMNVRNVEAGGKKAEETREKTGKPDEAQPQASGNAEKAGGREKPAQLDIHEILKARRAEEDRKNYRTGGKSRSTPGTAGPASVRDADQAAGKTGAGGREVSAETSGGPDKAQAGPPAGEAGAAGAVETDAPAPPDRERSYFDEENDTVSSAPFDLSAIKPVGVIFDEYILGSDADTFYMIDQHAAHERVFYERLTDSFYSRQTASQMIMTPITIKTSFSAGSLSDQWMEFLKNIGFAVEEFGLRTFIVREIPSYMSLDEAENFLRDFTESTESAGSFSTSAQRARIVTRACKSAVKANDRLSPREVRQLLDDLSACRNPFSCPHGRPTIIRMTHNQIDRMFRRQG